MTDSFPQLLNRSASVAGRLITAAVLLGASIMPALTSPQPAHALTIITQWTFNGSTTSPSTGAGTASLVGSATATFASGFAGESNGGWNTSTYPAQGSGSKTAGAQFQISTTGWQDIQFFFHQRHSNTAANTVVVQYSINSGVSFADVATFTVTAGDAWYTRTVDFSAIPGVNNIADFRVRVVSAFAPPTNTQYVASNPSSTYGTGGTLRFDNVTFSGNPLTSDAAPAVSAINPANSATNVPLASNVVITFTEPVNVTGDWFTLSCSTSGTRAPSASNVTVSGGPTVFTLDPTADFSAGETCALTVFAANVTDQDTDDPPDTMAANFTSSFTTVAPPPALCTDPTLTQISAVQGTGPTSPLSGTVVTVRGIVVGDFETINNLQGFYIQSETPDGNPLTSEGLFVFNGGSNSVSLGDLVVVTDTVRETNNQTRLGNAPSILVCGTAPLPAPTDVNLPFASAVEAERYEGMRVRLPQNLLVTDNFYLGRFGQVTLSSGARLQQPTHVITPGAPALALQAANDLNRILLDDDRNAQNPDPIIFARNGLTLTALNTLRGGDTVSNIVGVMTYGWGGASASPDAYRVRPTQAVTFVAANPRPTTAPNIGGSLRAAGANLLNYFNTFGTGACTLGVGGSATDCRGAENTIEFSRQISKTVPMLLGLNADVIGLMELENDGYGPASAVQDLVNRLNAATAPSTYAFINPDAALGVTNTLGVDAIKVGIIYRPGRVTPVGQTAVLTTGAFGVFSTTSGFTQRNRPPLAQSFQENVTGARFTIVVNHLKSKGSSCADNISPVPSDPDMNDGQGNCNLTRTAAAQELAAWLAGDPTGIHDPDILIVGDLNSYAQEDPITALKTAGYVNLVEDRLGPGAYSYSFSGQWGYLDYALASPSLNTQVSDVVEWHVNADEPSVLDYNTNFKSPGQQVFLYSPDPFRSSDHDPVIVGLNLNAAPQLSAIATYDTGLGGNGAEIISVRDADGALTNAGDSSFDLLNLSDILAPTLRQRIGPTTQLAGLNSLAIHPTKDLILAVAGSAAPLASPVHGRVLAYRLSTGAFITEALAGIQPDAIGISPDGAYAVVANEAEAPDVNDNGGPGSISIVDLTGFDPDAPGALNVITLPLPSQAGAPGFSVGRYDDIGRLLIDNTPGTLEPESVAFSADAQFAFVSLQENNGVARVALSAPHTLTFFGLYSATHYADLNNGGGYNPTQLLTAWREPDGVAVLDIAGDRYFITADEGDTRPSASSAGVRGGRTVSLFRADDASFVADTAGSLDDLAARWNRYPDSSRSNRGGSEPEVVDAILFNGQAIAAVGLERANAVAIVDVSQPAAPSVFALIPTGAAPEGVKLVARNNALYMLAANEVSGTLTIARVPVGQHIFTQQRATASAFPLHDLTVLDPDFSDTFTVTLTVDPALGGLNLPLSGGASGDFNVAGGVYTVTGSITDVNATLASALFTPTAGLSVTVIVSAFVSDGAASDSGLITLNVNASFNVSVTVAPTTLPVGALSTITATVTDQSGLPAPNGTPVTFAAAPGAVTVNSVNTLGGVATTQVTSTVPGATVITATVSGGQAGAVVTFTAGAPAQLTLSAAPAIIFANGVSQSIVVASVFDQFGNPVPGVTVQFLAGLGVFSPSSGATNAGGQVTVTLTSLTPGSENVSALAGSRVAQTGMTYQQPPTSQLGLVGNLTAVTQTLDAVRKGDVITYVVTITNSGSGALNNVLVVAPIPSGTVYIAGSAGGGNYIGSGMSVMGVLGPAAPQNAITWSGGLASGASHTLSYAVQVLILEGQIVNQPRVYAGNEDTGIDLSSVVPVQARKTFLPVALR